MQRLGEIPAFCLPEKGGYPHAKVEPLKQRKGLRSQGFSKGSQKYTKG